MSQLLTCCKSNLWMFFIYLYQYSKIWRFVHPELFCKLSKLHRRSSLFRRIPFQLPQQKLSIGKNALYSSTANKTQSLRPAHNFSIIGIRSYVPFIFCSPGIREQHVSQCRLVIIGSNASAVVGREARAVWMAWLPRNGCHSAVCGCIVSGIDHFFLFFFFFFRLRHLLCTCGTSFSRINEGGSIYKWELFFLLYLSWCRGFFLVCRRLREEF